MLARNSRYGTTCSDADLLIDTVINIVKPYYDQPHRFYHTIQHVERMFMDARMLDWKLTCQEILAIGYHDIIWVAGDDEASVGLSAKLLKQHFEQGHLLEVSRVLDFESDGFAMASLVDDAASIVLDTFKHYPHSDVDSSRVIDLDMFGFSKPERQLTTVQQLEQEYCSTNYGKGRADFLISLLSRKPFYHVLGEEHNKQAYTTILNELTSIKGV